MRKPIALHALPALMLGVLAAVPAAASDACDQWDRQVTTTPVPPQSARALQFQSQAMQAMPSSVDAVLIGDSIAARFPMDVLRGLYPGLSTWNAGVGGDRTQQTLWRLNLIGDRLKPRHVLVILGINNIGAGDKPCAVSSGMEQVLRRIDILWDRPEVTYLSIPSRNPQVKDEKRLEAKTLIYELKEANRSFIDIDDIKNCQECYTGDGVHLTVAGYRTLSDMIRTASGTR